MGILIFLLIVFGIGKMLSTTNSPTGSKRSHDPKTPLGLKKHSLQQVNDYAKGKDITMATLNEVYLYMTVVYKD